MSMLVRLCVDALHARKLDPTSFAGRIETAPGIRSSWLPVSGNIACCVALHLPARWVLNERVAPSDPCGRLQIATPTTRAHLSRLAKSGRALRLAQGVYVVDATLPPEALARHHAPAIASSVWPGAILCDRSAFSGPVPVERKDCPRLLQCRAQCRRPSTYSHPNCLPEQLPGSSYRPKQSSRDGAEPHLSAAVRPALDF
jgi:hypothetical protein